MKDKYNREINYLRISVTDLCNMRCKYCIPEEGIEKLKHEDILSLEEISKIAEECVSLGVKKIRLTGGEPLLRKGMLQLVELIGGLKGLEVLAVTTNAVLLKKYAGELKDKGVSALNISLNTMDEKKYTDLTRGGNLKDVLEGIEEAKKIGFDSIKLNVVLMKGINDNEVQNFVDLTKEDNIDVRFIELMPMGKTIDWSLKHFLSNDYVLEAVHGLEIMADQEESAPATYYKLQGSKGRVGLISPVSQKFCKSCNRLRLSSEGKLKTCLHSGIGIDIKTPLRNGQDIKELIKNAIYEKSKEHDLDAGKYANRMMNRIGG